MYNSTQIAVLNVYSLTAASPVLYATLLGSALLEKLKHYSTIKTNWLQVEVSKIVSIAKLIASFRDRDIHAIELCDVHETGISHLQLIILPRSLGQSIENRTSGLS